MKTKLNLNVPDDLHGGLLTPGVMIEGVMTMNQACFEYIASDLIRRLHFDNAVLRYYCEKESKREPEAYWDPKTFEQDYNFAVEYNTEEKEKLQYLHDFLQRYKEAIASYKEALLEELKQLLSKVWEEVQKNTHCSTSAVHELFRVIYCTEGEKGDATHTFEIFCIDPDIFGEYYHQSWIWFDKGGSMTK